ncbi:MAG TPA: ABC transporter substrate-binding protein [Candidatus Acidoferrales bacterium]|nr:ABC transporter substrate-binding protein [Candidatus Acidoferrales bacterium]
MKIRIVSFALSAMLFALCLPAEAQQKRIPRIGVLLSGSSSSSAINTDALRQGLHELDYIDGQNISLEYRFAEGKLDRLSELAAELVRLNVNVIVTGGGPPTRAAKNATNSIPIVMIGISDPVALGFVTSLARPGGNMTGLSSIQTELGGKRLELLKETVPQLSRVAVLVNPGVPGYAVQMREVEVAAPALALQLQRLEVRGADDLVTAFSAISKRRASALTGLTNPTFNSLQVRIAELAVKNRLPTIYGNREFSELGGLMSYGPNYADSYRRAATFVDKILKGAKPADLPVEQPTTFELVINLKTAKQMGLTIPPNVLARADRVIK